MKIVFEKKCHWLGPCRKKDRGRVRGKGHRVGR